MEARPAFTSVFGENFKKKLVEWDAALAQRQADFFNPARDFAIGMSPSPLAASIAFVASHEITCLTRNGLQGLFRERFPAVEKAQP